MASLKKRGKNSYRLRWIENGERKSMTFHADTINEAEVIKQQKERELFRAKSSRLRLNDLWERYKRATPRRDNLPHEEAYWKGVHEFLKNCFLHEITRNTLNDYKNWLLKQYNKNNKKKKVLLSSSYVNTCLRRFRAVWNFGRDEGLIERENDIFYKFIFPSETKRQFVLSIDEFNHLYETTKNDNPLYAVAVIYSRLDPIHPCLSRCL